jgi:glutamate-1-semialdehyde aminotransferase
MANGMPLGAISGKAEFMKVFDDVFYSTTFAGETLSLAAFKATVKELKEKKALQHIFEMGTKFSERFSKIANEVGANITTEGLPCKIKINFKDKEGKDSLLVRSLFCQETIESGIFFWQGPIFHTFSHSEDDLEKTLESVPKPMKLVKDAIENNSVEKLLKGKSMNQVMHFPV